MPLQLVSLRGANKAWLHQRIAQRTALMLAQGLVDEVQGLKKRGDLHLDLPSMRCVGYRQTWQMLDGEFPAAELAERISTATRQLAKRQMTWLRSSGGAAGLPAEEGHAAQLAQLLA